jgi:EmrB/QacA subfamily drug resistance transporter
LIFFDQTAVTVALPAIARDFGASAIELQWTITAYLLSLAVFMAIAGRLADRFGRKRMFLGGIALFGASSALCAVTPSLELLIAARFVQGIGGAFVQPLALSNSTRAVPEHNRGWAIGMLSTGGTTFLTLGPILAGAVLAVADWRWIFLLNLPVVAFSLAKGIRWIRPSRDPNAARIEVVGTVLLLFALAGVVLGVTQVVELGPMALVPLGLGLALLAVFVWRELHTPVPLIRLDLLRNPMTSTSLLALLVIQFAVLGMTVYLTLFLQHGLGESVLTAGLVLALAGTATPLLSPTTGRLTDRLGPRALVLPGLVLAAIGLVLMATPAGSGNALWLLPGIVLFSLSRPAIFTPASVGPIMALPVEQRGLAASLVTEARQLGAVLGVAALGAVYAAAGAPELDAGREAATAGFATAMLAAAAVIAAAAVVCFLRMPRRP